MEQTTYTTRVLTPSNGYKLTQANDVEITNRIISDMVFLAATDAPENWKEITDAEAEEIKKQQADLAKANEPKAE